MALPTDEGIAATSSRCLTVSAFFQLIALFWAIAIVPLTALLALVSVTWSGRIFALAALCAGLGPLVFAFAQPRWRRMAAGTLAVAVALYAALAFAAPRPLAVARAQHLSSISHSWPARLAPVHVLPEQDQLALGYFLMVPVDPLLTLPQAVQLRRLTADVYREMDADEEFRGLPSELSDMYASLLSPARPASDGFIYIPRSINRHRPAPALVFLHGSGGNFKAYLWILSRVADATGSVLIAPSNGFGAWQSAETQEAISSALARARTLAALDDRRLSLIGLSNGGLGVCQAIVSPSATWASAILISPVFDDDVLASLDSRQLADQPILVLTGETDDRVPLSYVQTSADRLARAGAKVTVTAVPAANHFLIFSHRHTLTDQITQWLHAR